MSESADAARGGRGARAFAVGVGFVWVVTAGAYVAGVVRVEDGVALGAEVVGLPLLAFLAVAGLAALWHAAIGLLQGRTPVARAPRWVLGLAHAALPLAAFGLTAVALLRPAPSLPESSAPVGLPARDTPDIVLVTLDTFRADHLGALGGKGLTPNLDELSRDGLLFTQAVTVAPLTAPAHASMLSGQEVPEHGLWRNGSETTVATVVPRLRAAGYATGAFLSAAVLARDTGLARGFVHYDDVLALRTRLARWPVANLFEHKPARERRGDATVARALRWRAAQEGPTFTWVHLYDAHGPYRPPKAFGPSEPEKRAARLVDRKQRGRLLDIITGLSVNRIEQMKLNYRGEVRFVDHLVGQLTKSLAPDTVVIVVADHGESLDEHDYFFNHGATLWEESLHVPLIVRAGNRLRPARVDHLASVSLIAPTLLWAAGLAPAKDGLVGLARGELTASAVTAVTSGQQARRDKKARGNKSKGSRAAAALRLSGKKLLAQGDALALYDLVTDPREAAALSVPAELAEAAARLRELAGRKHKARSAGEIERLRALGYVE